MTPEPTARRRDEEHDPEVLRALLRTALDFSEAYTGELFAFVRPPAGERERAWQASVRAALGLSARRSRRGPA